MPVFSILFDIERQSEFTVFLDLVGPPGTRAAFADTEDMRILMESLHLPESICQREGIIDPVGGQYLMRSKALDRTVAFDQVVYPEAAQKAMRHSTR